MATWPTIVDDDGSNTTGTIVNNANVWTPIQSYIGGGWPSATFAAGNFTANGSMTWTVESGDVAYNRYVVIGKTMIWGVTLTGTTIGGTPSSQLLIAIPAGATATAPFHQVRLARCVNNGSVVQAYAQVATGSQIVILLESGGNWATGTNNNDFAFQIVFEIA